MPFSDNLYSIDDDSDTEPIGRADHHLQPVNDGHRDHLRSGNEADDEVFAPADGYFHAASPPGPYGTPAVAASSNVPHVPNVWVRDPSLEQGTTAESKAREARQETLANNAAFNFPHDGELAPAGREHASSAYAYQPSHRSSGSTSSRAAQYQPSSAAYTPSTTASYTSYAPRQRPSEPSDQRSPFFSQDAPPAYTPSATASSTSPTTSQARTDLSRNYSTFLRSDMGREETQGLLADNPQSMGGPDDEFAGVTPAWRERVKRRVPYLNGRNCRVILLGLVLLAITLGFLISAVTSVHNEKESHPSPEDPPAQKDPQPITNPPHMDDPAFDGDHPWNPDRFCKDLAFRQPSFSFDLSFGSGKELSIVQDVKKDDPIRGRDVKVSGDVIFRRSRGGDPGPSAVVSVITNDENITPEIQFLSDPQALLVTVPRSLPWGESSTWPCMRVQVTVWVPADAALYALDVETVHLGIQLVDDLSLQVGQTTRLTTVVGPVVAADGTDPLDDGAPSSFNLESRWIEVKSTSADIKGHWPLYDYLGLHSTSGNIRVGIEPREVSEEAAKPANLYIKSLSGDVEFQEPIQRAKAGKYVPPRDYRVNIETTSGDIKGGLAFSSTCRFHSTSGDLDVDLLPVLDTDLAIEARKYAWLETASTSGTTTVRVRDPLWFDGISVRASSAAEVQAQQQQAAAAAAAAAAEAPAFRSLRSRHSTTSANIKVRYPPLWEGDLDLSTISGRLRVSGKDVRKIKEGSEWPGVNKHLLARKGAEGAGSVTLKTTSGNIDAAVY